MWPIYALTHNPILCYNLLFLSTFALSGFGMFLLGRELTGSDAAGFVAGLAFAFAPYRMSNIPHLQVLSSAWMPFVLFGLHRLLRDRPPASADRCDGGVAGSEPVVRLLPAVLHADRPALYRVGVDPARDCGATRECSRE